LGFMSWAIAAAVAGLLLVENIFSAGDRNTRWATKHLLIGAGGAIFAYDLFLYSDGLLLRQLGEVAYLSRPLVNAVALPLLLVSAVRVRGLSFDVSISRDFVLHTWTLMICGAYLIAIALSGYLVREIGLSWGPMLQLAWLSAALIGLAALLASNQMRARLRSLAERYFFSFHYDYRKEWLRFVRTISGQDDEVTPLYERAIRSMAEPLNCSSGCLYLTDRSQTLYLAARHFWRSALVMLALPGEVGEELRQKPEVVDLRRDPLSPALEQVRKALPGAWLLVPISTVHGKQLGAMVLANPRVPKALTWEDRALLAVLADQVASFIAEEQTTRALLEAQRFQRISKGFSFVAHDLKNVTSQLSVMLQQAKKHGSNPEFQADVLETVALSVEKMRSTLVRLNQVDADAPDAAAHQVELAPIVEEAARRRGGRDRVLVVAEVQGIHVSVEPTGFTAVLDNLLVNAAEASADAQPVVLRIGRDGDRALLRVEDQGCGMTEEFVRKQLFQPFASTKPGGFGLGMYQCRELVEGWSGTLEVASSPGAGTVVSIRLPLGQADTSAAPRIQAQADSGSARGNLFHP
ncbi:MAG: XrtA/PEP-CTERM system histidine kinase PrsK, partial [Tistlia sp.]